MSTSITLEALLLAVLFEAIVGVAAFLPLFFALNGAWKKANEQSTGADYAVIYFLGVFFLFQAAALAVAMGLIEMMGIVIGRNPDNNLSSAIQTFWTINFNQVTDGAVQRIAFIVGLFREFFVLICAFVSIFPVLFVLFYAYRSIVAVREQRDDSGDYLIAMFKSLVNGVVILICIVGWSQMVSALIQYPGSKTPLEIGQNWWKEAAGVSAGGVTKRSVTPDGMSDADALRKGLYVPKQNGEGW